MRPKKRLVAPDLIKKINDLHSSCVLSVRLTAEEAWQCGTLLAQAKKKVKHGNWQTWIRTNLVFGPRQAQKYLRFARIPEKNALRSFLKGGLTGIEEIEAAQRREREEATISRKASQERHEKVMAGLADADARKFQAKLLIEEAERQVHTQRLEHAAVRRMQRLIIDLGFRAASLRYHPDKKGGTVEEMQHLVTARDELNRFL